MVPGQTKSTFEYDSDGRKRISTQYTWDANANVWTQTDKTQYIYDGMNLIQERDGQGNVKTSFVRDGNIGGILSMTNADGTFDYHYDGNGNVVALTNSSGNIVAKYSYDAYGNLISSSGSEANKNPFRYSTKFYDSDTGLYDYGARHYDPKLGRWINRDPLGVSGGINLYGFVGNSPGNAVDGYGLGVRIGSYLFSRRSFCKAIKTGAAAVANVFTFGLYKGGKHKNEPGYNTSHSLAEGARALLATAGGAEAVLVIGKISGYVRDEGPVIGRVKDIERRGLRNKSLLDDLPDLGSPKANWRQNSSVLRRAMRKGLPIFDVSPGDNSGQFLNAERNLLRNHGWSFDSETNLWNPPRK